MVRVNVILDHIRECCEDIFDFVRDMELEDLMKVCRRTISKQGVGKPHVIFPHDGNGISPGICRQRTHIKFAFPKKISGKNMELIRKDG